MTTRSWIRTLFAPTPRTVRKAPARFRPRVETLENRLAPATFTVTTLADENDGIGTGGVSLREAISEANSQLGTDTIQVRVNGTINLTSALPNLSSDLAIDGPGAANLTVRRGSGGNYGIFEVASGATVGLSGLTITNGFATGGGGILNGGTLTVSDCSIVSNFAGFGGGISNSGTLTISDCIIAGNSANISGGGISNGGTLEVSNSTLNFNSASVAGGGIFNNQGTLTIREGGLTSNSAGTSGGGIYNNTGTVTVSDCSLFGNDAPDNGGGIYISAGEVAVNDSTLSGNVAEIGGGIYVSAGTLSVSDSTLSENVADLGGGILNAIEGTLTVSDSNFSDNSGRLGGGGLVNRGTLTVGTSALLGNKAPEGAGIYNSGALVVDTTVLFLNFATFGGGILNAITGTMTVSNSIINLNSASTGGGIYNAGDLTVSDSLLGRNEGGNEGGGIRNLGTLTVSNSTLAFNFADEGGGIYSSGGALTVRNSTISENAAAIGGGILNAGSATLINSTVVANRANANGGGHGTGGGVLTFDDPIASTTLFNTIVAGNRVGTGSTANDLAGKNIEAVSRHNLIGDPASAGGLTHGTAGNIVGKNDGSSGRTLLPLAEILDPTLANNGGPTPALTHALLPGSQAIDAGAAPGHRLRTSEAFRAGTPEIGAYEVSHRIVVTTLADEDDGNADPTQGSGTSLREAINLANGAPGADTIDFSVTGTINLTGALPELSTDIDVQGPGANDLTVRRDVGGSYGIFTVPSGATVSLSGLTIANGRSITGGGIHNGGTLTVSDCTLSGNVATSTTGGGGIRNEGTLTVSNSTLSGNSTVGAGGGIRNGGTLTFSNSTLSGNSADTGGGIQNFGTLTFSSGTISSNSASAGGGINNSGTLTFSNGTLSGNSASGGGGIENFGTLTVSNSTLSGNSSTSSRAGGGGIRNGGTLTVSNSTLSGNSAVGAGGGVLNGGTLTVSNSTLSGNSAGTGGGVFNRGPLTVSNSTLSGNSATHGGGGIYNFLGTLTLNDTIVANSPSGGDVAIDAGALTGSNNLIESGVVIDDGILTDVGTNELTGTILGDPNLGELADNGGPTRSHALLPGSKAIDAGSGTGADQRDVAPVGARDLGAFESRGFTLTYVSGSDQSALINAAFAAPLVVRVTSHFGEPVTGGVVTFTVPASGASAALSSGTATVDAGGLASVTATADGTPGSYAVTAAASSATGPAAFRLTNTPPGPVVLVGGVLQITGSDQSDVLFVTRRGSVLRVDVRLGGSADDNTNEDCHEFDGSFSHFTFNAAAVTAIAIEARGGNDVVLVGRGVTVSASIDGGTDHDLLVAAGSASDSISDSSGNNLVLASGGNDTISTGSGIDLILTGSGSNVVHAGGGNDVIRTGSGNDLIFAGSGNDLVDSGSGNDVVVGGEGDDLLIGGSGRDLLIGGVGADRLVGNGEEDILIAGSTAYDANTAALQALMAEWSGVGSYATRVTNLMAGSGSLAGTGFRLDGDDGDNQTVFNDSSVDILTGNQGADWFLANRSNDNGGPLDLITDKAANELWSDTDF